MHPLDEQTLRILKDTRRQIAECRRKLRAGSKEEVERFACPDDGDATSQGSEDA